ncbi:alpha/beta fold hydrolase [Plastoroseomonas hellenica]|uniref:alpha/beta fold hydrolase n=1 Tax=Plastoroseomonas hellenica TaxID=2687306 RepID=UPI001BA8E93B|nr:hypothetical protein [Plastoroseomonas hellenica]
MQNALLTVRYFWRVAARLGNYPELGRRAAAAIPNATLVESPELGHSPQVEAPEQFDEALLRE